MASPLDAMVSVGWPLASNRYVNHLLGWLAPEQSFVRANSWPESSFPWTERRVAVCLSFDCDTPEDGESLPRLLSLLARFDIRASFAVVGELAEGQQPEYLRIVEAGHEVFNHGYRMHTEALPDGGYKPTGFYPSLSWTRSRQRLCRTRRASSACSASDAPDSVRPISAHSRPQARLDVYTISLQNMDYGTPPRYSCGTLSNGAICLSGL